LLFNKSRKRNIFMTTGIICGIDSGNERAHHDSDISTASGRKRPV
jgi:hypothetical protein